MQKFPTINQDTRVLLEASGNIPSFQQRRQLTEKEAQDEINKSPISREYFTQNKSRYSPTSLLQIINGNKRLVEYYRRLGFTILHRHDPLYVEMHSTIEKIIQSCT
jgi:hypothetical protein